MSDPQPNENCNCIIDNTGGDTTTDDNSTLHWQPTPYIPYWERSTIWCTDGNTKWTTTVTVNNC